MFCGPHKVVSATVRTTGTGFTVTVTVSVAKQPVGLDPVTTSTCVVVSVNQGFWEDELFTEDAGDHWCVDALLVVLSCKLSPLQIEILLMVFSVGIGLMVTSTESIAEQTVAPGDVK